MADPFRCDPFRVKLDQQLEVAQQHLGGRVSYTDPALYEEAGQWTSLVQIDSDDDAGMRWGDYGSLFWVMRIKDIAARRFDAAALVTQLR